MLFLFAIKAKKNLNLHLRQNTARYAHVHYKKIIVPQCRGICVGN